MYSRQGSRRQGAEQRRWTAGDARWVGGSEMMTEDAADAAADVEAVVDGSCTASGMSSRTSYLADEVAHRNSTFKSIHNYNDTSNWSQ